MKRADFQMTMKQRLLKRREALRQTLDSELALLIRSQSVKDEIDGAQDAVDEEVFSQLTQCEIRESAAIENALDRIRYGQYGLCEECGESISVARLRALPYATLCIECQREMERDGNASSTDWSKVVDTPNSRNGRFALDITESERT